MVSVLVADINSATTLMPVTLEGSNHNKTKLKENFIKKERLKPIRKNNKTTVVYKLCTFIKISQSVQESRLVHKRNARLAYIILPTLIKHVPT